MALVTIIGFLGADAEKRQTKNGNTFLQMNVAIKQRDISTWYKCTYFGDRYDKMLPYLKKGGAAVITGELNPPTTYQNKNGETKINLEIIVDSIRFSPLGKKDEDKPQPRPQPVVQEPQEYDFSDLNCPF